MIEEKIFNDAFELLDNCDLRNRPNYRKLAKHLKENDQLINLDKDEINYDDELISKRNELNDLKCSTRNDEKKYGNLNVYDEFIDKVRKQQKELKSSDNNWNQINSDMDKELKSLEMIQSFLKKNKTHNEDIKIDELSLVKSNDILKHFCKE